MKISEQQLYILIRTLEGTLNICDRIDSPLFGFNLETRTKLYNDLVSQLSSNSIEVEKGK